MPAVSVLPVAVEPVFADASLAAPPAAQFAAGLAVVASAVAEAQSREAGLPVDSAAAACARDAAQAVVVSAVAVAARAAPPAPSVFQSGGAVRAETAPAVAQPHGVAAVK